MFLLADKGISRRTTKATSIDILGSRRTAANGEESHTHTTSTAHVAMGRAVAAGGTHEDATLIIYGA